MLRGKTGTTGLHTNPSRPPTQRKCQRLPHFHRPNSWNLQSRGSWYVRSGWYRWSSSPKLAFSSQGSRPWLPGSLTCITLVEVARPCNLASLLRWRKRWRQSSVICLGDTKCLKKPSAYWKQFVASLGRRDIYIFPRLSNLRSIIEPGIR